MNTQHMVACADYGFTPVGGRVCKETDGSDPRAAPGAAHLVCCRKSWMFPLTFGDIYH